MKTAFQWLVIAIGGMALAAAVEAKPSHANSSNRSSASAPAPRAFSGASGAGSSGYRASGAASAHRPTSLPNYSGRMPTYSGGQRYSAMPTRTSGIGNPGYSRPTIQNFSGRTPASSSGQRFSSRGTTDRDMAWRQTFPRSNVQTRSNTAPATISRSGSTTTRSGNVRTTDGRDRLVRSSGVNRTTSSTTTQSQVFARKSANWQPNWDKNCDHWWNGHRCRFINGSWVIFNIGFYPWWPIGYPYDYYYGFGYPYGYGYDVYPYGYGYDPYFYGNDGGYYYGDDQYYGQDGYTDPQYGDAESPVAAAQERLAREGYYHGQIDGIFGPETQRALRAFQRDRGLDPSGYLTLETRQALGIG